MGLPSAERRSWRTQLVCDLPESSSSQHPLSFCFCFCIKKMLLLSSRRPVCYFVATTMKHEQFIILSVLCKHVMYWDVTKPQTHLSVSCAFHVYLLLIGSPRDPHWILPSPRRFSLPNKGPLPNWQGQGIHLKVASQRRKRQTQVVRGVVLVSTGDWAALG